MTAVNLQIQHLDGEGTAALQLACGMQDAKTSNSHLPDYGQVRGFD